MNQFKQHLNAAGHELAGAAGDISESVGSVVHSVGDRAGAVAHQARDTAVRAVEAVEEKCAQVGHAARDSFKHGRDHVRRWENDVEGAVRSRPIVSLLVAAGIGVVMGILWDRRGS